MHHHTLAVRWLLFLRLPLSRRPVIRFGDVHKMNEKPVHGGRVSATDAREQLDVGATGISVNSPG